MSILGSICGESAVHLPVVWLQAILMCAMQQWIRPLLSLSYVCIKEIHFAFSSRQQSKIKG